MGLKEILEHHIVDHIWSWVNLGPLRLPISKHLLMMGIASVILVLGLPLLIRSRSRALAPFRAMIEIIVLFLRDEVVVPNLGHKGAAYMGYFSSLFFFILTLNLLGLVPYGATATGNLAVTAGLALTTFALVNFAGIREQGIFGYFGHIVPKGVPGWLYPLLFPIELIGLVTKTFALCIRLFANMIAGHIVILAFISFIFIFGSLSAIVGFGVAPISVGLVLFTLMLELFVAFLQAYVFVFLTAIFTGAAMHPH
ncbi:MAG: ATP synthase F0 subunit A [Elusimicrobia bacterium CG_4_10_14_0_2_um_filter_56_8]|nr:MAG: ATP synthase F0 subunit A [Elusimicrobia bacterium CG1_02_56_21]PJA15168.1 MAG: ATP synthase F0 subunit A [Elusimicrobia bacterium CG_4_10_14_0_2_um_filter_56_8]